MRYGGTILCAIPPSSFEVPPGRPVEILPRFLQDLAALERRLLKNVAVDDERLRHAQLCRRIEEVVLAGAAFGPTSRAFSRALTTGRFPALRVGPEYLGLIRRLHIGGKQVGIGAEGRLGATIFNPDQLRSHVPSFSAAADALGLGASTDIQHRLWFLRNYVLPAHCGLIEVPDSLGSSPADQQAAHASDIDGRSLWKRLMAWLRPGRPTRQPAALPAPVSPKVTGESTEWMR